MQNGNSEGLSRIQSLDRRVHDDTKIGADGLITHDPWANINTVDMIMATILEVIEFVMGMAYR